MRVKENIYVADFETTAKAQYEKEGRTKVYLWEIKSIDGNFKEIGIDLPSFIKTLENINLPNVVVYFHNLSFDGEFILYHLIENGYHYNEDERELKPFEFHSITNESGIHYSIAVMLSNGQIIKFRCSYRLMPMPIKALGKLVGIDKLNETHDYSEIKDFKTISEVPEEELKYLENDVEILRLVLKELFAMSIKGLTMSGASFRNWQQTQYFLYKEHLSTKPNDEYINECITKSYKGGITKVNKKHQGKIIEDVISFDVNSLYPSQMLENDMPIGIPMRYDSVEKAIQDKLRPLRMYVLYVDVAKIRNEFHSFIGFNTGFSHQNSYVYPDKFEDKVLYLWEEEYNRFVDCYDVEYKITDVLSFRTKSNVFSEYLEHWKKVKETAPNKVIRNLAKLMMNSLYGRFGMRDNRKSRFPVSIDDDGILQYDVIETEVKYYYRPIASYITSMARVVLIDAIQQNANRFIYCDTDSIYLLGRKEPNLQIDANKLGYWKFEGNLSKFKALKPKCYIKTGEDGHQESSIAGLPKDAQMEMTYEMLEFGTTLKGKKKAHKRVKGGIIIDDIDFTLKTDNIR